MPRGPLTHLLLAVTLTAPSLLAATACGSGDTSNTGAGGPAADAGDAGGGGASSGGATGSTGGGDQSGGATGAGATSGSGGTSASGGAGGGATGGVAASGGSTTASGGSDAGGPDGPTPTDPCGTDLDVDNGAITPALGDVPQGGDLDGDPAANGPDAFAKTAISVPIAAEKFSGAGYDITLTQGTLSGSVWLPTSIGQHPLVVILPGFATSYSTYAPYAEHLATHGFLVVGVDTRSNPLAASHDTEALEVVRTIDWAIASSQFRTGIDPTKIAVAGHSKGGKLAFFAAALDPRIDLVIGWDPVNAGGGPCAFDPNCDAMPVAPNCRAKASGVEHFMHAETLVIGAPPDAQWNPEPDHNAVNFYRGAPSPASLVMLNTGHVAWAGGATQPDVFRITKQVHTAKLLQRFRGVTGTGAYLPLSPTLDAEPLVRELATK